MRAPVEQETLKMSYHGQASQQPAPPAPEVDIIDLALEDLQEFEKKVDTAHKKLQQHYQIQISL